MEKRVQDTKPHFNVEPKPEFKEGTSQSIDKKNVEDMDSNNTQKVKQDLAANAHSIAASADRWKTKLSDACKRWTKLRQVELVASGGDSGKISDLIQKHYALSKLEADKQVHEFFDKH